MTEYQCNDCKKIFKINSYKYKNKITGTYLCYPCSCKYNKLYWTDERREKERQKRILINKTTMRDLILNKSEKEKLEIANKKRKTFYNRSEEDRKEINKKRITGFRKYNQKRSLLKKNLPDYNNLSSKRKNRTKSEQIKWNNIRKLVFENCNYICQVCDSKGKKLEIHHLIPFLISKKHIYLVGVCKSCHCKLERKFENAYLEEKSIKECLEICLKYVKGSYYNVNS